MLAAVAKSVAWQGAERLHGSTCRDLARNLRAVIGMGRDRRRDPPRGGAEPRDGLGHGRDRAAGAGAKANDSARVPKPVPVVVAVLEASALPLWFPSGSYPPDALAVEVTTTAPLATESSGGVATHATEEAGAGGAVATEIAGLGTRQGRDVLDAGQVEAGGGVAAAGGGQDLIAPRHPGQRSQPHCPTACSQRATQSSASTRRRRPCR